MRPRIALCSSRADQFTVGRGAAVWGKRRIAGQFFRLASRSTVLAACVSVFGRAAEPGAVPTVSTNTLPVLTTAQQVRLLPPNEARLGRPVRLRGVITSHEPQNYLTFIQDETAGTYVGVDRATDRSSGLAVGQFVEVEGKTSPGKLAPFVEGNGTNKVKATVLGRAPAPTPIQL